MNRLKNRYEKEIKKKLKVDLGNKNLMSVPYIEKVVVNMGIGDLIKNKESVDKAIEEMAAITGQKPSVQKARVSVASFGIRRGMPVGLRVTLRGEKMYFFLDKLFSIVMPRLRDFRGVSKKSMDSNGNYSLGVSEHSVFPEIDLAKSTPHGLEITIVVKKSDMKSATKLLEYLGMPFKKAE